MDTIYKLKIFALESFHKSNSRRQNPLNIRKITENQFEHKKYCQIHHVQTKERAKKLIEWGKRLLHFLTNS